MAIGSPRNPTLYCGAGFSHERECEQTCHQAGWPLGATRWISLGFFAQGLGTFKCSSNMERVHILTRSAYARLASRKPHHSLQLRRPDARVGLRGVDARVAE